MAPDMHHDRGGPAEGVKKHTATYDEAHLAFSWVSQGADAYALH